MKDGCSPPISLETKPQRKLHHGYKVFVSTWNVGGALPDADLRLDNWLDTRELYDVYVLGFQEAVPLTPLNVIRPTTNPLSRWNYLISAALNRSSSSSSSSSTSSSSSSSGQKIHPVKEGQAEEFFCVASKQMVGILLIVWLRGSLRKDLRHLSISAVGCGAMGFMGNKGAISVSFFLQKKSFCFVCCHLSSGGAAGDEQRRNRDAAKILSRTAFLRRRPRKILDHDRIILLGDLNYRVSLPVPTARSLVAKKEWAMLLQRDQVSCWRKCPAVFWKGGVKERSAFLRLISIIQIRMNTTDASREAREIIPVHLHGAIGSSGVAKA
ncbi:type IV inositol polyphosphate 5-phosphatase 9-like isoform X2 [Wolffia australiana]